MRRRAHTAKVTRSARRVVVVALAGITLPGCAGDRTPTLPRACTRAVGPALDAALHLRLITEESSNERLQCAWGTGPADVGAPLLSVKLSQPSTYADEGRQRADDALATQWEEDDEQHVTVAVPGVGTSAYRFTVVAGDVVRVTVRAYRGFRQVSVDLQGPYVTPADLRALEERAVGVARAATDAS